MQTGHHDLSVLTLHPLVTILQKLTAISYYLTVSNCNVALIRATLICLAGNELSTMTQMFSTFHFIYLCPPGCWFGHNDLYNET